MPALIRILHLEDDIKDTEYVASTLKAHKLTCDVVRVDDSHGFEAGLDQQGLNLIISDFSLPSYNGRSALAFARLKRPDVPFIFFSGTMGEEVAIEALKGGAIDYVLKDRPSRLATVVIRALHEAEDGRKRQKIQLDLQSAQGRFQSIYESSKDAIVYVSPDGHQQDVNEAMVTLTGYSKAQLLTMAYHDLTAQEYCDQEAEAIQQVISGGQPVEYEKEIIRRDGCRVPIVLSAFIVQAGGELPIGLAMILKDVTDRKRAERDIIELAYHDALTGLPNRRLFDDRLKLALCPAARTGKPLAVLALDLDGFKTVNDTLGHAKGDLVLQGVAERLRTSIRSGDTVARSGGDEFIILLPELSDLEGAERIAEKLLAAFAPCFILEGQEFAITASIGLSVYPKDGMDPDGLARSADAAMYRAKKRGGNTYELSHPPMKITVSDRLTLERNVRRALERREFRLYYQPVIELNMGRITGMEALLRWQHPTDQRLLVPAEFIEVAEETGAIVPLSLWVLQTACSQLAEWHKRGYSSLRVAVNLSNRQIWQKEFVTQVQTVLKETDMAPGMLEFEITERMALQNPDVTISVLTSLSRLGIDLSMDDFGTGHGSLSCLRQMPLKTLKMDQSFVGGITKNTDDAAIVKTLISLGHNLRLKVIAEGVETPEQLEFLQAHQCDAVQGFLFSRAVCSDDFEQLVATQPFIFGA